MKYRDSLRSLGKSDAQGAFWLIVIVLILSVAYFFWDAIKGLFNSFKGDGKSIQDQKETKDDFISSISINYSGLTRSKDALNGIIKELFDTLNSSYFVGLSEAIESLSGLSDDDLKYIVKIFGVKKFDYTFPDRDSDLLTELKSRASSVDYKFWDSQGSEATELKNIFSSLGYW